MPRGKFKGSEFERTIAKKLSLWISRGERSDLFWRTHSSGGRWTRNAKRGQIIEGQDADIAAQVPDYAIFNRVLSIECKHYKDLNLWSLLLGGKGGIIDFWRSTVRTALDAGKIPVLIARQNRRPILWITNSYLSIELETLKIYPRATVFCDASHDADIYLFEEDLINRIDPDQFIKILRRIDGS